MINNIAPFFFSLWIEQREGDSRMPVVLRLTGVAIANLWFGLEALFGDTDQPVKANLAKRISAWLPGSTDAEVRDLYKNRCEAVHGRWLDENRIIKAIQATEDLLRRSLIKCIETRTTPLPDWK